MFTLPRNHRGRVAIRAVYTLFAVTVFFVAAGCGGGPAPSVAPTAPSTLVSNPTTVPIDTPETTAAKEPTQISTLAPTDTPVPSATPQPTQTPYSTSTPLPTYTPQPTYTPYPTSTALPTYTPYPTATPSPTNTPRPTATPLATVNNGEEGYWIYFGSECPDRYENCALFASDLQFISLAAFADTNESFYDAPRIRVSCWLNHPHLTFDGGGPWIGIGEPGVSLIIGSEEREWFWPRDSDDVEYIGFDRQESGNIIRIIQDAESQDETLTIGASSDYDTAIGDFDVTGVYH